MELKRLTAGEGEVLTNGIAFGKVIHLGANDDESNWYEITEEKYKTIIEESEEEEIV